MVTSARAAYDSRMTKYAIDPEFEPMLPLLPTISDLSSVERIQTIRDQRADMFQTGEARDDVIREDRTIPGPEGAPDVQVGGHVFVKFVHAPAPAAKRLIAAIRRAFLGRFDA